MSNVFALPPIELILPPCPDDHKPKRIRYQWPNPPAQRAGQASDYPRATAVMRSTSSLTSRLTLSPAAAFFLNSI